MIALRISFLAVAALLLHAVPAHAARSYDNCTGFIDTLPATITTQGTWCLRAPRTTTLTSGAAITIATNNVTLDCNDFRIEDTVATQVKADGIAANARVGITVRNCLVIGFLRGVALTGAGGGHTVEDNRLYKNRHVGMAVHGDGSLVRRNEVFNTGPSDVAEFANAAYAIHIRDDVDVLDNAVDGVSAATASQAYGVWIAGSAGTVAGNRIHAASRGVFDTVSTSLVVRDNRISGASVGITCANVGSRARRNLLVGLPSGVVTCTSAANVVVP